MHPRLKNLLEYSICRKAGDPSSCPSSSSSSYSEGNSLANSLPQVVLLPSLQVVILPFLPSLPPFTAEELPGSQLQVDLLPSLQVVIFPVTAEELPGKQSATGRHLSLLLLFLLHPQQRKLSASNLLQVDLLPSLQVVIFPVTAEELPGLQSATGCHPFSAPSLPTPPTAGNTSS